MKRKIKLFVGIANELNIGQYELIVCDDQILVYSLHRDTKDRNKVFYSTHLTALAESMNITCYVKNDAEGCCCLHCF